MEIRKLGDSDFRAMIELEQLLHDEHVAREPDRYVPQEQELTGRDVLIDLGAFEGGRLVGFVLSDKYWRDNRVQKCQAHVISLYVLPEYRRKGIATQLMRQLKSMVDLFGYGIRLGCVSSNKEALEFYYSMGFREVEKILEVQ